ncbi:MAG: GNAT family N-acetyltransferase [Rhizomicrobium sp.]
MSSTTITVEASEPAVNDVIHAGLRAFNRDMADWPERQYFNVVLRDAAGRVRGGLLASLSSDVLRIDDLFIEEAFRRRGCGEKLVAMAEAEGHRRGARLACVMTFSFQARPFYEKLGYDMFAELPYQGGAHTLYWLKKLLCA